MCVFLETVERMMCTCKVTVDVRSEMEKTTSSPTPGGLTRPFETQTHTTNALTKESWR